MKLNDSIHQSAQSSSGDTHQFKISANGVAFQILSSGLYSNKAGAVLRELGCNAADAHIAAGIGDTPIEVHLPTQLEPVLSIRDYGLGLSHEQVLSLYTTYFSSDKRNTNKQTGGLGLGSKSPFAYTDSFTVTSIHNGIKRLYTCNISADGAPTVTRLHEEPTQERQGIEVQLFVELHDTVLFYKEAFNIYQWFDVRPKFNIEIKEFNAPTPILLKAPGYSTGGSYNMIKMGNVAYPLMQKELDLPVSSLWEKLFHRMPLTLHAPIGYLQVAASREALQYDPVTKKNLIQLYQQAYTDIARRMVSHMLEPIHKTAWQQMCALLDWKAKYLPPYLSTDVLRELLLHTSASNDYAFAATTLTGAEPSMPYFAGDISGVNVYYYAAGNTGRKNVFKGRISIGTVYRCPTMSISEKTCIVVADGKHINDKISQWRSENATPCVILVSPSGKKNMVSARDHAESISQHFQGMPVRMLSNMPLASSGAALGAAVKRDYVEIDDRLVDVYDFVKGASNQMRFGDVPSNMKYALVRNTTSGLANSEHYFKAGAGPKEPTFHGTDFHQWSTYFVWLKKRGIDWHGPAGAIMLRPVDVTRLKIEQAGVPWLMPSMASAMCDPINAQSVSCGANLYTLDSKCNTYGNKPMTMMESGWIGDAGVWLAEIKNPANTKKKDIENILNATGLTKDVVAQSNNSTRAEDDAFHSYAALIRTLHSLFPETLNTLALPMRNQERNNAFMAAYPMSPFVSSRLLHQYLNTPTNDNNNQQMLNILRCVFGLPAV